MKKVTMETTVSTPSPTINGFKPAFMRVLCSDRPTPAKVSRKAQLEILVKILAWEGAKNPVVFNAERSRVLQLEITGEPL